MKRIVLILYLVIFVTGSSNSVESRAEIQEYHNRNDGKGNYFFRFLTSNGITREETGHLVNAGQPGEHVVVEGFYSYIDPDGNLKRVDYKADENGYSSLLPFSAPALPKTICPKRYVLKRYKYTHFHSPKNSPTVTDAWESHAKIFYSRLQGLACPGKYQCPQMSRGEKKIYSRRLESLTPLLLRCWENEYCEVY